MAPLAPFPGLLQNPSLHMLGPVTARAGCLRLVTTTTTAHLSHGHRRFYSSAASMASSLHNAPDSAPAPPWLQKLLEDRSAPPRLYAWRPDNLPGFSSSSFPSSSFPSSSFPSSSSTTTKSESSDSERRIYIVGVGNLGRLYASCLAKLPRPPPITLVVHRRDLLEHWAADPGLEMTRHGEVERSPPAAFDIEWWTEERPEAGPAREVASSPSSSSLPSSSFSSSSSSSATPGENGIIRNLLVSTKASDALPQVDRLRRYLSPRSTVGFVQNGMCKLWPPLGDAYVRARFPPAAAAATTGTGTGTGSTSTSPSWVACVTTHGVYSLGPFRSVHASPAGVTVGPVRESGSGEGGVWCGDYLMEQVAAAPGLGGVVISKRELWVSQLEKLVVNSVLNPLTALLRCQNGDVMRDDDGDGDDGALAEVRRRLVAEASAALRALVRHPSSDGILVAGGGGDGEGQRGSGSSADQRKQQEEEEEEEEEKKRAAIRAELLDRFSPVALTDMLGRVMVKVAANTSSMLQDVRAGKRTEVADINGWLVETARHIDPSLRLPTHERVIALVEGDGEGGGAAAAIARDQLAEKFSIKLS